jgi:hypothetical protein
MSLLFTILIAVLIVCLVAWIITLIPVPAAMPWIRNVLYIILALVMIAYLASYAGCDLGSVNLGGHHKL